MQNRYAGDIGDFGKFGLLQAVSDEGLSIGINWYKAEPTGRENLKSDGSHLIPKGLFVCNEQLAKKLYDISCSKNRSIEALENARLINSANYYSIQISLENRPVWHETALASLSGSDIVFLDPDNGLLAKSVKKSSAQSAKYAFYEEIKDYLNNKQSVIVYNHRCRKKPDIYFTEIFDRLSALLPYREPLLLAITFPKGSVRDYFAICINQDHFGKITHAFEKMAHGIWGDMGMCRLQPLPFAQCPKCGNDRLVPILYGMPTSAAFEKAKKGSLIIGGCCIEDASPKWYCPQCKYRFGYGV